MTRFRQAVETWRENTNNKVYPWPLKCVEESYLVAPATVILSDVVKAVDAYERTIKQLKQQNAKLRKGMR